MFAAGAMLIPILSYGKDLALRRAIRKQKG